uniref:Uncharacterized protein n=1 Tax=Setaria viridis TaxID=4556 RepID=A0A4U6V1C6_SETVI|nr:LOW QUALITY PROTEIN: hypothetical protein SEVIR_4G188400v2 [Setaria viridis]
MKERKSHSEPKGNTFEQNRRPAEIFGGGPLRPSVGRCGRRRGTAAGGGGGAAAGGGARRPTSGLRRWGTAVGGGLRQQGFGGGTRRPASGLRRRGTGGRALRPVAGFGGGAQRPAAGRVQTRREAERGGRAGLGRLAAGLSRPAAGPDGGSPAAGRGYGGGAARVGATRAASAGAGRKWLRSRSPTIPAERSQKREEKHKKRAPHDFVAFVGLKSPSCLWAHAGSEDGVGTGIGRSEDTIGGGACAGRAAAAAWMCGGRRWRERGVEDGQRRRALGHRVGRSWRVPEQRHEATGEWIRKREEGKEREKE